MAGETEFTSTEPPPRHSAPDCDIYPSSPANPMLLPPTRFDPPPLVLFSPSPSTLRLPPRLYPLVFCLSLYWLGWTHPSQRPLPFAFHFNQPSLRGLSAAFHLRGLNPSSHSSPPLRFCHRSAMLSRTRRVGEGIGRGGDWWATLGSTSSTKKHVYGTVARGPLLYVVFCEAEGWHSSSARIRNPPAIRGA